MTLCTLCSSLPFTGFPRFCPEHEKDLAGDGEFVVANDSKPPDRIGFPYHENLSALAKSAKTCSLCAIVQEGVQAWLVSWKNVAGNKPFVRGFAYAVAFPEKERLWLTAMELGKSGFCVWTEARRLRKDVDDGKNFYLLTMVGFSVGKGTFIPPMNSTLLSPASCLAHDDILFPDSLFKYQFPRRSIDLDSGSSRSLDRAASWVQNCVNHHQKCSDGSDVLLPSRVLDVKAEGDRITLIDGPSVFGKSGKYACLSYCVSSFSNGMSLMTLK